MVQRIDVEGTQYEFPDGMPDADISRAIDNDHGLKAPLPSPAEDAAAAAPARITRARSGQSKLQNPLPAQTGPQPANPAQTGGSVMDSYVAGTPANQQASSVAPVSRAGMAKLEAQARASAPPAGRYDTVLTPEEETMFRIDHPNPEETADYDLRGAWKAGAMRAGNGHLPDTWKKPNHVTFSDESQYHGVDGNLGGHWQQQPNGTWKFSPGPTNFRNSSTPDLQQYFRDVEPKSTLNIGVNQPDGDSAVERAARVARVGAQQPDENQAAVDRVFAMSKEQRAQPSFGESVESYGARLPAGGAGDIAEAQRYVSQVDLKIQQYEEALRTGKIARTYNDPKIGVIPLGDVQLDLDELTRINKELPALRAERDHLEAISSGARRTEAEAAPPNEGTLGRVMYSTLRSYPSMAAGIGVGALAGPVAGTAVGVGLGGLQTGAQTFSEVKTSGDEAKQRLADLQATSTPKAYLQSVLADPNTADSVRKSANRVAATLTDIEFKRNAGQISASAARQMEQRALGSFQRDLTFISQGADAAYANVSAAIDAAAEGAGEAIGIGPFLRVMKISGLAKAGFFPILTEELATNFGQEFATQVVQSLNSYMRADPNLTFQDALQQAIEAGMGGALMAGAMHPPTYMAGKYAESQGKKPGINSPGNGQLIPGDSTPPAVVRSGRRAPAAPGSSADLAAVLADPRPLPEIRAEQAAQSATELAPHLDAALAANAPPPPQEPPVGAPELGSSTMATWPDGNTVTGTVQDVYEGINPDTGEPGHGLRLRTAEGKEINVGPGEAAITAAPLGAGTPTSPIVAEQPEHVDTAAARADTTPTEAQKEAGNYSKGHIDLQGLDITIENPKGGERSGEGPEGPWSVTMPAHYGYIKRTVGADTENVDVYVGDVPNSQQVWVVDQLTLDGDFDEHKVMLGFPTYFAAKQAYIRGFSDGKGPQRAGAMTHMSMDQFKEWLKNGRTTKPVAFVKRKQETQNVPATEEKTSTAAQQTERQGDVGQVQGPAASTAAAGEREGQAAAVPEKAGEQQQLPATASQETAAVRPADTERGSGAPARAGGTASTAGTSNQPGVRGTAAGNTASTQAEAPVAPSVQDIHRLADEKGIPWDNDAHFMAFTKDVTGKEHLDALTPAERQQVHDALQATVVEKPAIAAPSKATLSLSQSPYFAPGARSAQVGEPRKLPGYFTNETSRNARAWFAGYDSVPSTAPAAPAPKSAEEQAKADLDAALADLGDLLGKNAKLNITPEQEQKLLPVLTRLFDAAFRLGYLKFKDAARFVRDKIAAALGKETADSLTLEHFQGAYIGMSGRYRDKGADSAVTVAGTTTLDEGDDNVRIQQAGDGGNGPQALEGIPADEVPGAAAERPTGESPELSSGNDAAGDGGRSGGGILGVRGVGSEPAGSSAAEGGTGPVGGRTDEPSVRGESGNGEVTKSDGRVVVPAENFTITDELQLGNGTLIQKYNGNVEAIRLLKKIESEYRMATPDEQAILARYVGWGGIKQAFPVPGAKAAKGWEKRVTEIADLLTPAEHEAAARSIQDAHYTSQEVVDGMWRIAQKLGFYGGKVLESSMGTGNFFGLMPHSLRSESHLTGVELDDITARIAKQLYPKANVMGPLGFHHALFGDNTFNLSIGNPPFGAQTIYDPSARHFKGWSIHNFFFGKAIDKLAPGGLHIAVVSRYFMDAQVSPAREYIAHRAELVGAIRLPWTAFYGNAGTEVVTDIVILKKLPQDQWGTASEGWTKTEQVADPLGGEHINVNSYFAENPDNILGVLNRSGEMLHDNDVTVQPMENGETIEAGIERLLDTLPEGIYERGKPEVLQAAEAYAAVVPAEVIDEYRIGSYFESDGKLHQRVMSDDGSSQARELTPNTQYSEKTKWGDGRISKLRGMIRIRDITRSLLEAEKTNAPETKVDGLRNRLNKSYDAFVKEHGFLNEEVNERVFREDPDAPLLLSLELGFDVGVKKARAKTLGVPVREATAHKNAIFTQNVVGHYAAPTSAANAKDGLAISIAERGGVSVPYIAQLTGKPENEVIEELTGGDSPLAYYDPADSRYETADLYLSGNVKRKYEEAKKAGLHDQAKKLKEVFPPDVKAGDLRARLGAPWVDNDAYVAFYKHLLGEDAEADVRYIAATGGFAISSGGGDPAMVLKRWGSPRRDAHDLINRILNNKDVTVFDKGLDDKRVVNKEATDAANERVEEIKQEFEDWVFKDNDQRERLVQYYNDHYNTTIETKYDGSYLELPGKIPDAIIKLRRHQNNAIARFIRTMKILLDHVVGAGKTYTIIAAVMELRRIGLAKKPMIVVPNHLVQQWATDFYRLYPGAKILAMSKADFAKNNRRRMLARVATGDWDAVIFSHSSFGFIANDKEVLAEAMREQIAEIQSAINIARATEGKKSKTASQYQKQKDRIQARLDDLNDKPRDDLLTFQEIGVDVLMTDESQEFKNLFFTTQKRGVGGLGNPAGSKKAFDLFIKMQWLQKKQNGRGVGFATGTPISNSLTELYTLQRYLGMGDLQERGLLSLDAWLSAFGVIQSEYESNVTGTKYKRKERMRRLTNVPEVMQTYRQFADSVTLDDIKRNYAEDNDGAQFPVPTVKGGKPRDNVVVERSDAQARYSEQLQYRMEHLTADARQDNALAILGDGRKAALDMRLVDPDSQDFPGSKVNEAAGRISEIYEKNTYRLGTQLVFLDLSTPQKHAGRDAEKYLKEARALLDDANAAPLGDLRTQWSALRDMLQEKMDSMDDENAEASKGIDAIEKFLDQSQDISAAVTTADLKFSVYDDLRQKLIDRNIPGNEIAFIHDFNGDTKKQELFDMVKAGRIRVLLGSTAKMGAGTNVQNKLVALHHLDCPWRPSDIEQREGRIIRQGNEFRQADPEFEVEINAYATEGTSDVFFWQTQEQKLNAINSLRNFKGEREIEDVSADSMSAAEMKALASGNPLILEDVTLTEDVRKLEAARRRQTSNEHDLKSEVARYERTVEQVPAQIQTYEAMDAKVRAYKEDPYASGSPRKTADVDGKQMNSTEARDYIKSVDDAADAKADAANAPNRDKQRELQELAAAAKDAKDTAEVERLEAEHAELRKKKIKPEFKVTVNGKEFTGANPALAAIADELGDAKPFRMVLDGKELDRRNDAERALDPILATMHGDTGQEKQVGTIAGVPVTLQRVKQKYGGGIKIHVGVLSEFVDDQHQRGKDGTPEAVIYPTGTRVLNRIMTLLDSFNDELNDMRRRLDTAQKGLEPLKAQLGKPFAKEEELATKKKRLAEVRSLLAGEAPKQSIESESIARAVAADWPGIAKQIADLARQITPQTEARAVPVSGWMSDAPRGAVAGEFNPVQNIIEVAYSSQNPGKTFRHEAVHALRAMGLFTQKEWLALRSQAQFAWMNRYNIPRRYSNLNEEGQLEEAVADAYGHFATGGSGFSGISATALGKIKEFFKRLANMLRGMGFQTAEDVFRRIESGEVGRRSGTKPAAGETKHSIQDAAQKEVKKQEARKDESGRTPLETRVLGRVDTILDRETLSPERMRESVEHAKGVFDAVGLAVVPRGKNMWDVADKLAEPGQLDDAGYKLLDRLKREIRTDNTAPGQPLQASLLTSIAEYIASDENVGMSSSLRLKLYEVAQGARSHAGVVLGAFAQLVSDDPQRMARTAEAVLHREYSDKFDGKGVELILDSVLKEFRESFTDAELGQLAQKAPELISLIERLATQSVRDNGGRLYRRVQQLFKDKKPKTLEALNDDAMVNEAVEKIIADLKQQGIEPKDRPGKKKLTPLESLLLMVTPETQDQIDAKISEAVAEAERNAGIKAALKDAPVDEKALLKEAFDNGLEPERHQIEKGLADDEFKHWKILRDNLLGYSPTTLKLVQDVIRGNFKGTKFGQKPPPPPDLRIDLNKLAKAPAAEVQRVLDAHLNAIEAAIGLRGADGATLQRVSGMIQANVAAQLEAARARVRDKAFDAPAAPGQPVPPELRLRELFNAGLLGDARMDDRALVARIADKAAVRRLVPTMTTMLQTVFETPFYRQAELAERFGRQLSGIFGLSDTVRQKAVDLFKKAYDKRFEEAHTKAVEKIKKKLTPAQAKATRENPKLWEEIEKSVNAGLFDSAGVLQQIARSNGWTVPTQADLAEIKTLARREQELRELTDEERARAEMKGNVDQTERDKAAATLAERSHLKREMQALWLRWIMPLTIRTWEGQANIARAVGEATSANLLLRPGFFVRQIIDVATQTAMYTPSRAYAEAKKRYDNDKSAGRKTRLLKDTQEAIADAYRQRSDALRAALANAKRAMAGRSETKNVEQILDRISIFDRAELRADELAAEGKTAQAFMMRVTTYLSFAFRFAKALDELQGVLVESQEMQANVVTALRETGMNPEEARVRSIVMMGDMTAEWMLAIERTRQIFEANDMETTPALLSQSAWDMVKSRQYGRIAASKLLADDFEGMNRLLRNTVGWNEAEGNGVKGSIGGPGGLVSHIGKSVGALGEHMGLFGIPLITMTRFSNAIGVSINRTLTFTPLGYWSWLFKGSPWYASERDKIQRKVEATAGTSLGLLMMALVAEGILKPLLKWPDDEAERELWRRSGRQPGTVEINLGDGKVYTVSMTVGPFSIVRPYLAFMGTIMEGKEKEANKQQRLAEKAYAKGLTGQAPDKSGVDYLAAATAAAYAAILGGRTAFGIVSNVTGNQGSINVGRVVATNLSPLVPGVPQWQEISRMAGIQIDNKTGSILDFMVPIAGSDAEKKNFFGDPLNEHTFQRITKVLTGGTYPFATTKPQQDTEKAYQVLYEADWRPPAAMNVAREIGGTYRTFTHDEMQMYLENRGRTLKEKISAMDFSKMNTAQKHERLSELYGLVNERAVQQTIEAIRKQGNKGRSDEMKDVKLRETTK